jgi:hypothetical protein
LVGIPVRRIRGKAELRTAVGLMAFYSGCSLVVTIPQDYSRKDDLTQFLESKLDGCEISVVEDSSAKEPFAQKAIIKEDSQLNSLQGTRDFASPTNPAPAERTSIEFLMGAAADAIQEFISENLDVGDAGSAAQRTKKT